MPYLFCIIEVMHFKLDISVADHLHMIIQYTNQCVQVGRSGIFFVYEYIIFSWNWLKCVWTETLLW